MIDNYSTPKIRFRLVYWASKECQKEYHITESMIWIERRELFFGTAEWNKPSVIHLNESSKGIYDPLNWFFDNFKWKWTLTQALSTVFLSTPGRFVYIKKIKGENVSLVKIVEKSRKINPLKMCVFKAIFQPDLVANESLCFVPITSIHIRFLLSKTLYEAYHQSYNCSS